MRYLSFYQTRAIVLLCHYFVAREQGHGLGQRNNFNFNSLFSHSVCSAVLSDLHNVGALHPIAARYDGSPNVFDYSITAKGMKIVEDYISSSAFIFPDAVYNDEDEINLARPNATDMFEALDDIHALNVLVDAR